MIRDLDVDLTGYDHRAASRLAVRRLLPFWLHQRGWFLLGGIFLWFIGTAFARRAGIELGLGSVVLLVLLFVAALSLGQLARKRLWTAVATAPSRAGRMRFSFDDEGVHVVSPAASLTLFWAGLYDAQPGPGGILLMTGACDFYPIPANAFADKAEEASVLAELQRRIAAAKGSPA